MTEGGSASAPSRFAPKEAQQGMPWIWVKAAAVSNPSAMATVSSVGVPLQLPDPVWPISILSV